MFYELCHNRQFTRNPCYICHIVFPFCSIPNCFLQQIHGRLIIEWIPYSFYCPLLIIKKAKKIKLFWHNDAEVFAFAFSLIEILYAHVPFYSQHCRPNHHNNRLSTSVLWESLCHDRVIVDKPKLCDMIYIFWEIELWRASWTSSLQYLHWNQYGYRSWVHFLLFINSWSIINKHLSHFRFVCVLL